MTTHRQAFDDAFVKCPLIAILRGVKPDEVEAIGDALVEAGFTILEVPMNSPDPLDSIARLARRFEGRAVVGAGTVLRVEDVEAVGAAGGTLIIAPNANVRVIATAAEKGYVALPGIATPTEAFAALDAGAAALKLFPAEDTRVLPVGGIVPELMADWRKAGAAGFGLGSALFAPGMTAADVGARASRFIETWNAG
jgi:2-dehydro-3-deoxyphosphogalactonate aldolase